MEQYIQQPQPIVFKSSGFKNPRVLAAWFINHHQKTSSIDTQAAWQRDNKYHATTDNQ
jgi:hypothetical protein